MDDDSNPPESAPAEVSQASVMNLSIQTPERVIVNQTAAYTIGLNDGLDLDNRTVTITEGTIQSIHGNTLEVIHHRSKVQNVTITVDDVEATFQLDAWAEPLVFPAEPGPEHKIRPGMRSSSCTTNFIFTYQYERYFIGTNAHCINDGNWCDGTDIPKYKQDLEGGFKGIAAYDSFASMRKAGFNDDDNSDMCHGNDFGLIEIAEKDWPHIHPKSYGIVGHIKGMGDCRTLKGGFNGIVPNSNVADMDEVLAYGRSSLRSAAHTISEPDRPVDDKEGYFMSLERGGFSCNVYLATPGIPGDSGGPLTTRDGLALGGASTINTLYPGENTYTNTAAALEAMQILVGWAPELVTSQ